jgi:hypothetical protein
MCDVMQRGTVDGQPENAKLVCSLLCLYRQTCPLPALTHMCAHPSASCLLDGTNTVVLQCCALPPCVCMHAVAAVKPAQPSLLLGGGRVVCMCASCKAMWFSL